MFIKLSKYWAVAVANNRTERSYLINLLSSNSSILIRIWVFVALYKLTFRSMAVTQIDGLNLSQIVWILAITQSLGCVVNPDVSKLIEEDVRSGNIAYMLNRPYSFLIYQFACFWGRSSASLPLNIGLSSVITAYFVGGIQFNPIGILAAVYLAIVGLCVHFLMNCMIGLLSFWIEDVSSFRWLYQKAYIVFGGMILPTAIFPTAFRKIAEVLPFAHIFHSPAQMVVNYTSSDFYFFAMVQSFWLVTLLIAISLLFTRVVRNLSVNGG